MLNIQIQIQVQEHWPPGGPLPPPRPPAGQVERDAREPSAKREAPEGLEAGEAPPERREKRKKCPLVVFV